MYLEVDPVICQGRGWCQVEAPDLIEIDDWGYPILENGNASGPLFGLERGQAERAARICPLVALRVLIDTREPHRARESLPGQ